METATLQGERRKRAISAFLANQDTFGTSLLLICLDTYGVECLAWEPETLHQELQDDYRVLLPQANADRLQSLITAITTDRVYNDALAFCSVANALSGDGLDASLLEIPTPDETAWAVTELGMLEPENIDSYSADVRRLMKLSCETSGLGKLPGSLSMSEPLESAKKAEMFTEDPAMYAGWASTQQSTAYAVDSWVKRQLLRLVGELSSLPLVNRDAASWKTFAQRAERTFAA